MPPAVAGYSAVLAVLLLESKLISLHTSSLTHISLSSFLWEIDKQCRTCSIYHIFLGLRSLKIMTSSPCDLTSIKTTEFPRNHFCFHKTFYISYQSRCENPMRITKVQPSQAYASLRSDKRLWFSVSGTYCSLMQHATFHFG